MSGRTITATERQYQDTILAAAKILGWRRAHFRPAQTKHGWRTAVAGDGKGFPDLMLLHAQASLLWFVELKRDDNLYLQPDQLAWREDLIAGGFVHKIVSVPSDLDTFLAELRDVPQSLIAARRTAQ